MLKSGELLLKLDKDDEEGKENIKKAIEIFGKEKGKESRAYGKLMSKLGVLYLSLDKIEEGIAFLEQSYQIQCSYEQAKILSKKGYDMLLKYLKEEKIIQNISLLKKENLCTKKNCHFRYHKKEWVIKDEKTKNISSRGLLLGNRKIFTNFGRRFRYNSRIC